MTSQSGKSSFDERGVGRFGDVDLMARTALRAHARGEREVAMLSVLLPGVLERIVEIQYGTEIPENVVLGED